MCGITGWIDWKRDLTKERPVLEAMRETLAHRGPDDSGLWVSPRAGLAHRRLMVVDPEGGRQPMARSHRGRDCVLVYNGELYNTPDLRRDLEALGWVFESYSDTEVLLVAYMQWGEGCLERLNGIFAFAVWDAAAEKLVLARDRLGVKPLFYAVAASAESDGLVFGSEIKAVLAHPGVQPVVDSSGLAEILIMGPARTPGHGIIKGISEVRPGCYLVYDRLGTRSGRYWSLESKPHEDTLETTAETVRWLLEDTVTRQLVSDVPVCTLLSGGLDSSAVSAYATASFQQRGQGPLHTYSIDYAGNEANFRPTEFQPDADGPWVRKVSAYLGTIHHYFTVDTPELVGALTDSMRANDLPGMADVDSSLLLFCRRIKEEATVALSGEAADEIFGGYPWFRDEGALWARVFPWSKRVDERASLLDPDVAAALRPREYAAGRLADALAEVPSLPGEDPLEARRREMFYLNITRFMPTLLDRKDRMSMATGLEVRVPYCDHRLVDYLWNVPWQMKFADDREKGLLRRALHGVLPEDVLRRKKSPYPKTHNPAYLEATRDWLQEILADAASPIRSLLDLRKVKEVVRAGGRGFGTSWFGQLMGGAQLFAYLAQTDTWLREYHIRIEL